MAISRLHLKGSSGFEINGLQEKDPSGQHPETLTGVKAYGNGEKLFIESKDDGTIAPDNGRSSITVSIEADARNVQAPASLLETARSGLPDSTVTAQQRTNVTDTAKRVLSSVRQCMKHGM